MPQIKNAIKMVVFTPNEVWDALRAKFPEAGMPEKFDPNDIGDEATEMAAVLDKGKVVPNDFSEIDSEDGFTFGHNDNALLVKFVPQIGK